MSEPITPTAKDRAETRRLASAIVESVRNDERMPLPFDDVGNGHFRTYYATDVESLAMQLAQEVCALQQERDESVRLLAKATHGGDITNDDWHAISRLMKAAGVEP